MRFILTPGYLLLIMFFSLCITELYARPVLPKQKDTASIAIATTTGSGSKFLVQIHKDGQAIKIVYTLFDSIRYSRLKNDTAFIRLSNLSKQDPQQGDKYFIKKYLKIINSYRDSKKDSIYADTKTDTAYGQLIDQVILADQNELNQKKARIILDGMSYLFTISTISGIKEVSAHSPIATSHPLLYKLLTQTFEVYRHKKNNSFLDKQQTNGY